jgi:L-fuconolactonase
MLTIDAQVHAYERDRPERPWTAVLAGPPQVTGDDMVAAMDDVGVDGAILVSPYTMYRYDASYALDVYAKHPNRFALVKPVDPADPGIKETIDDWAATDGAVAVRVMMAYRDSVDADHSGIDLVLKTAAKANLPVNLLCWDVTSKAATLAAANPNTQIVIDHLALKQPFEPPPLDEPFADLPKLLNLAQYENVAIKITGACTLSKEPYPYNDIWDPLNRVFDAFGFDRCLWGTDWTRATNFLTYQQGVDPFRDSKRFSESEKTALMGQTLARIYQWRPTEA